MSDAVAPIDVISDTKTTAGDTVEAVAIDVTEATVSDAGEAATGEASEAATGEASEAATGEASEAAKASEAATGEAVEYILDSIQVDHPMRAAIREELRAQIDPLREQLEALVKLLVR